MKINDRERFTLRLPTELYQQLLVKSATLGISVNALILQILWDWAKEQEK